jgi:hypothetical protein
MRGLGSGGDVVAAIGRHKARRFPAQAEDIEAEVHRFWRDIGDVVLIELVESMTSNLKRQAAHLCRAELETARLVDGSSSTAVRVLARAVVILQMECSYAASVSCPMMRRGLFDSAQSHEVERWVDRSFGWFLSTVRTFAYARRLDESAAARSSSRSRAAG